jgi:hypothetical protein
MLPYPNAKRQRIGHSTNRHKSRFKMLSKAFANHESRCTMRRRMQHRQTGAIVDLNVRQRYQMPQQDASANLVWQR